MNSEKAAEEVRRLSELLRRYQYEYYVKNAPSVTDMEYDRLFDRLVELEKTYPELKREDSPTHRVGSDLSADLKEVEHTIPVLSLDKAYSVEDVYSWLSKTSKAVEMEPAFFVEEKIDGVSIVLYYEGGILKRAVTRGNGYKGNDVTGNVKTLGSVPLRLSSSITVAVRGEIFLPVNVFREINSTMEEPYANPRNLAAGTIRRLKSSEVAEVPLSLFVYEGYFTPALGSHLEVIETLEENGFPVNPRMGFFSQNDERSALVKEKHPQWHVGRFEDLKDHIVEEEKERETLRYEIDGLVVKVDTLKAREALGATGHHPRWALAYKFDSPQGITEVSTIDVQLGRTGRITPVARVKPVAIGGSTVSNVTLHNQDYIDLLELAPGDTVAVSKRGDVIPAVEKVLEKSPEAAPVWKMPENCPSCNRPLVKRGAHHFCVNKHCPVQVKERIYFFIGTGQMDIDHLGPETAEVLLDRGMVEDVDDIYTCDYDSLKEVKGFGEKKVALIKEGVEKSKSQPYPVVLRSLGIPELGQKAAELLLDAGFTSVDTLLEVADRRDTEALEAIHGIGPKTAATIIEELSRKEMQRRIEALKHVGLQFAADKKPEETPEEKRIFEGQTWCVTGSFEHFQPRSKAMEEVKRKGGKTTIQVSGSTTHLLVGEGGGSKEKKAKELGVELVTEENFLRLLDESPVSSVGS